MINQITKNFITVHDTLKDHGLIKSTRQFALALGSHSQTLNDIVHHRRNVSLELLRKVVELYPVNSEFLLKAQGDILEKTAKESSELKNLANILFVPAKAHAGYMENINNDFAEEDFLQFTLPDYAQVRGSFRCFEAFGDSMEPNIYSGEKLICSLIDSYNHYTNIRDNFIYVIVTSQEILVKRVINLSDSQESLLLVSDNDFYEDITVHLNEVKEVWKVETKISQFLHSKTNSRTSIDSYISELKEVINLQSSEIKEINSTVDKLIKSNRTKRY